MINHKKLKASVSNIQIKLYQYLIIMIVASIPFSYYRRLSFNELFLYCNVILFFFLFYKTVDSVSKLRIVLFVYSLGSSIYAIFCLRFGKFSAERLGFGETLDPNDIAYFMVSFLTFNLLFLRKDNNVLLRCVSFANILLCSLALLKTGSRGGLLSLLLVIIVLLFGRSLTLNLSFIKKIAIFILTLLSLHFVDMNTERYKTLLSPKTDYNFNDETGRVALWKMGVGLMLSHPLTGVGLSCFNEGIGREREKRGLPPKWQTAHNSLIQIGAETGLIGFFLFAVLSFNAFKIFGEIVKKSKVEDLAKIGELARIGFIGHFVSAMFLSQAYSVYWAFYIVLSAVLKQMLDNESIATVTVS
ncbi:MAG: O-antigen ligase family protein [Deltaproteobacteria bacterium]